MATDKEIGERLREARKAAGYETAADAARKLGVAYPTYAGHENGSRGLRASLETYAKMFGVTVDQLLLGAGKKLKQTTEQYPSNASVGERIPPGARTIPLYGHAVGGADGEFVLNGNKLDDILAPPSLSTIDDAYAVTVSGESMEPRYFDGETVFIDPHRRVSRGNFVVAQIRNPGGEAPLAYIKRFVRRNALELILEQFNPPKELRFSGDDVVSVHFIVMGGQAT